MPPLDEPNSRPTVPILALTPNLATARRLALLWGAHCVHLADIKNFNDMVQKAVRAAHREEIAQSGQRVVVTAGVPFGTPGSTNAISASISPAMRPRDRRLLQVVKNPVRLDAALDGSHRQRGQ